MDIILKESESKIVALIDIDGNLVFPTEDKDYSLVFHKEDCAAYVYGMSFVSGIGKYGCTVVRENETLEIKF